jgi:uncharacterized repeat protein (TIGR01451 family)
MIGRGTVWFDDIHVNAVETPTLVISKTDAPDPVKPGQSLVYTVCYSNTGRVSASQVVVTETYDANVTFDNAKPTPEPGGGNCVWKVGTLGPQQSGCIVITVMVNSPLTHGWTLTNLVGVGCTENVTASHIATTVVRLPTLVISKTDAPDPVKPGQSLVYTIRYSNIGQVSASQVIVTETYDANVTFGGAKPAPESGSGNRVWKVDTLGPQQSGLIAITVTVNSPLTHGWTLTNLVEIGCAEGVTASHITTTVVHSSLKVYLPTVLKCYIPPSWYRGSLDKLTFSVAACPAPSKDTVYAGTDGQGVFRSTDGGATWNYEGGTGSLAIMGLAVHPSDCQTAYAATWKGGVYKRSGTSWLQKKEGLGSCLYSNGAIAIDPTEPLRLYVGVRAAAGASGCGMFISTNGGDSWARTSLRDKDVGSLFIASRTPYTVYAGTTGGVSVSINGGNTWSALGSGLPYTQVWAVVETPAGQVYAGTEGKGLYRLEGDEWKPEPILGRTDLIIYGLRYVTDSLYVTTLNIRDGVYRLKDNKWYTFSSGLPQPPPEVYLYQMASTERRLYIATSSGVWWYPLP